MILTRIQLENKLKDSQAANSVYLGVIAALVAKSEDFKLEVEISEIENFPTDKALKVERQEDKFVLSLE